MGNYGTNSAADKPTPLLPKPTGGIVQKPIRSMVSVPKKPKK